MYLFPPPPLLILIGSQPQQGNYYAECLWAGGMTKNLQISCSHLTFVDFYKPAKAVAAVWPMCHVIFAWPLMIELRLYILDGGYPNCPNSIDLIVSQWLVVPSENSTAGAVVS